MHSTGVNEFPIIGLMTSPRSENTQRVMLLSRSPNEWVRPFSFAYSAHSTYCLALQVFLLSRAFLAIETKYELKLEIVRICDWLAIVVLLFGFVFIAPYMRQIFLRQEIVHSQGPSLITELGPQLARNFGLFLVICIASLADFSVRRTVSFRYAVPLYFILSLIGITIGILVKDSQVQVLIVSSACLASTLHDPKWFSDWAIIVPIASAVLLLAYRSMAELKEARSVVSEVEVEVIRIRAGFLVLSGLCMVNSSFQDFGWICLVVVGACNGFLHIVSRKHGSMEERQLLKIADAIS